MRCFFPIHSIYVSIYVNTTYPFSYKNEENLVFFFSKNMHEDDRFLSKKPSAPSGVKHSSRGGVSECMSFCIVQSAPRCAAGTTVHSYTPVCCVFSVPVCFLLFHFFCVCVCYLKKHRRRFPRRIFLEKKKKKALKNLSAWCLWWTGTLCVDTLYEHILWLLLFFFLSSSHAGATVAFHNKGYLVCSEV